MPNSHSYGLERCIHVQVCIQAKCQIPELPVPVFPVSVFMQPSPAKLQECRYMDGHTRGAGFAELREAHFISQKLLAAIDTVCAVTALSRQARKNQLSLPQTQLFIKGLWYCGCQLFTMRNYGSTELESCCRLGVVLYTYVDVQPFDNERDDLAVQLACLIHLRLLELDTSFLLTIIPEFCLWISLLAGTFAEGESSIWFRAFLRKVCTHLLLCSWKEASACAEVFLMFGSDVCIERAQEFWNSSVEEEKKISKKGPSQSLDIVSGSMLNKKVLDQRSWMHTSIYGHRTSFATMQDLAVRICTVPTTLHYGAVCMSL